MKLGAEKEQFMLRHIKGLLGLLTVVVVVSLIGASLAAGQAGTASLRGTIIDKSGAGVPEAKVRLENKSVGFEREAVTGNIGDYEFLALPPGTYAITVEKDGFRKYEQTKLQLPVNLPTTLNLTLEIGSATEVVEVSAATQTLNTTDASIGNAFSEAQVKELPLEGRNVPELLSLQPGVAYPNNRADVPSWDTRKGAVNGARSDQSNVTVDGVQVNDSGGNAFTSVLPVTLDSVQEFRVTTSNYNADQGSTSGGQVSLITKSGTNSFHGSVYEYHRNTYTSANDYFVKSGEEQNCINNGTPLSDPSCNKAPKLIRNTFGGSFGGPIKKDRLYFFANYEGNRRAEASSETVAVPSAAMKDGIIQYQCHLLPDGVTLDTTSCPGGTVAGLSGQSYNMQPGYS